MLLDLHKNGLVYQDLDNFWPTWSGNELSQIDKGETKRRILKQRKFKMVDQQYVRKISTKAITGVVTFQKVLKCAFLILIYGNTLF